MLLNRAHLLSVIVMKLSKLMVGNSQAWLAKLEKDVMAKRSERKFSLADLALLSFVCSTGWTMIIALSLKRAYQDTWILESLEKPFFLAILSYLLVVVGDEGLRRTTVTTPLMTFLLSAAPGFKYEQVYGSTIDVAAHVDMTRAIADAGHVLMSSAYRHTPGFHLVAGQLAALTDSEPTLWLKLFPAILGSTVPLAYTMLCRRAHLSREITRSVALLSVISLPPLHNLNGTAFTAPLVVALVTVFATRGVSQVTSDKRVLTVVMLFVLSAVILWHPATSLVLPLILLTAAGLQAFGFRITCRALQHARLASVATLALVVTLCYWLYDADLVWSHFVKNIGYAFQVELTPDLIPATLSELTPFDWTVIALLFHARDLLLLVLAGLGVIFLSQVAHARLPQEGFLQAYATVWLASCLPLLLVIAVGFGSQGYKRFLIYAVVLSPILAGYALTHILSPLEKHGSGLIMRASRLVIYLLIYLTALFQMFPYQPAVPTADGATDVAQNEPIIWLHQVNTRFQEAMLAYAAERLPGDHHFITDFIGLRQNVIFLGDRGLPKLRRAVFLKSSAAYLLLHWPGEAGPYSEQLPYRTRRAIAGWRWRPGMITVYDNGGSFILFYPNNASSPFYLERPDDN